MKKNKQIITIFLSLFLCYTSIAKTINASNTTSTYTSIPDINFEKALIAKGLDSGIIDHLVLTANISSLKTLNVSNYNISDLTGIQDFVALTNLSCDKNQLTTLDVTKNTALTYLDCSSNLLIALNLNTNTALYSLTCNSNQFTTLDLNTNLKLWYLYCNSNKLTTINLNKNTDLFVLECNLNQLTALDLSLNTDLVRLYCTSNQLVELDLSKNNNLNTLVCDSNQLITVNIKNSHNNAGGTFSFLNNPNLGCIQVDDKSFMDTKYSKSKESYSTYTTDCSSFSAFTYIPDVNFENYLIYKKIESGIADGKILTAKIDKLTSLSITSSPTNPKIDDLTGIQDFISLTYLVCTNNNLTSLDLSKNIALTELNCSQNYIKNLDLSNNSTLSNLDCSYNQIMTLDINKNPLLKYLDCTKNQLTTLDISKNTALNYLGCSYNFLSTLDINSTALKTLNCTTNQLQVLDLSKNVSLTYLGCALNKLTSLDVSKNIALTSIDCSGNQISAMDVSKNIYLTSLGCSSNQITALDLSKNIALTVLVCSTNHLTTLNLKNGNNFKLNTVNILYNPNLSCVQVDEKTYADNNWSNYYNKDITASYQNVCTNLSDKDFKLDYVSIYPNPTKEKLNINNITLNKVTIYDLFGKSIKTFNFDSNALNNEIDLSDLSKGIYLVSIKSNETLIIKKIILE